MKKILFLTALILSSSFLLASDGDDNGTNSTTTGSSVLSINLSNFRGSCKDQYVVDLSWATVMERDVDHFDVLRSGDGIHFDKIDTVDSKMTINTSDYQLNYSYTDSHPLSGTTYYKIRVVGKNGGVNQSPVIQINIMKTGEVTKFYPTLIQNNFIYVESGKTLRAAKLEVFDLSGKKISETNWPVLNGKENAQISTSGSVPSGTYVIRLTASGETVKTQLVIVQSH